MTTNKHKNYPNIILTAHIDSNSNKIYSIKSHQSPKTMKLSLIKKINNKIFKIKSQMKKIINLNNNFSLSLFNYLL